MILKVLTIFFISAELPELFGTFCFQPPCIRTSFCKIQRIGF
ncbi:hypothetical protein GLYMA_18G129966v4 [Glycine max]|nr:hypothetical protein GLYMA_18G129966v4 [Glycine max]KAH1154326.1 hypothetical protein GYH30_049837 [Glycine max]